MRMLAISIGSEGKVVKSHSTFGLKVIQQIYPLINLLTNRLFVVNLQLLYIFSLAIGY